MYYVGLDWSGQHHASAAFIRETRNKCLFCIRLDEKDSCSGCGSMGTITYALTDNP
jgi:hypothetical protein